MDKTPKTGFFNWLGFKQNEPIENGNLKGHHVTKEDELEKEIDMWTVIEKDPFEEESKELNSYKIEMMPSLFEDSTVPVETKKTHNYFSFMKPVGQYCYQVMFAPKKETVKFDFEQCKSEVIKKAVNILPQNLPEEIKEQFSIDLDKSLNLIDIKQQIHLQKLSEWLDAVPKIREKEIELLKSGIPHPIVIHEVLKSFQKIGIELNTKEMPVMVFIQKNLFDMFERLGPMNNQLTEDSFPQMIYHPRYIVENGIQFGTTMRELLCWGDKYRKEELENNQSSLAISGLLNDHYQSHAISNFVYSKITWHMEEGKEENKDQRLFQKGYMEVSLAIPTVGDIRSARIPLDLSPFHFDSPEALVVVGNIFKYVNGAGSIEKQKVRLNEMLRLLKKLDGCTGSGDEVFEEKENSTLAQALGILPRTDETYQLIKGIFADGKITDLFVQTVLRHNMKSEEILTKLLIAVGDPTVHFDDVQEIGDRIPQTMIKNICENNSNFKEIWKEYQKALGDIRDHMIMLYMDPKKSLNSEEEISMSELAGKFFKIEELLLNELNEKITNPQDVKIIGDYLEKIRIFNTSVWKEENFPQLKLMNQAIAITEKIMREVNKENEILSETYQTILYPILADRESLRVFIDWLRIYKIDHKEGKEGFSFHRERLKRKSNDLASLIKGRDDLNENQKILAIKLLGL